MLELPSRLSNGIPQAFVTINTTCKSTTDYLTLRLCLSKFEEARTACTEAIISDESINYCVSDSECIMKHSATYLSKTPDLSKADTKCPVTLSACFLPKNMLR